jgi:hypothetical protein
MTNEYVPAIFGLVGVVVGGALTVGYGEYKERKSQSKDLGHLAIHVVRALEEYIDKALSVYWDNGGGDDRAEHEDAPYPAFNPEELTGEWKSFPAEVTYRIFNLQTKTAYAVREINSAAHQGVYGDHDEFYEDRQRKFGDLTEEAIVISDELRALAKLPARETRSPVWDSVKMFKLNLAEKRAKQLQKKTG